MSKSVMLAAVVATMAVPGAAAAIDTYAGPLPMRLVGLDGSLGTVDFTAQGRTGDYCRYLMTWESPFNPNDVELCDVRERRTVDHPSCIENRHENIGSAVMAGPATPVNTLCSGFDNLGDRIDTGDISLLLGGRGALEGLVILPWGTAFSIEIARRATRVLPRPGLFRPAGSPRPRPGGAAAGSHFPRRGALRRHGLDWTGLEARSCEHRFHPRTLAPGGRGYCQSPSRS